MSEKAWLTDTDPSTRFPVFTRLNAADVMADPITPLGATMCWIPNVLPGWASGYVEDVCFTADELAEPSSVAGFFYGYLYVNQSSVRVLGIRKGMTADIIDTIFFNSPGAPVHVSTPSDQNEALSAAAPARAGWVLTTSKFEGADEDAAIADRLRNERPNLRAMSNRGLVARARSVMPFERLAWRSEQIGSSNAAVGPAVAGSMLGADKAHLLVTILGYAGEVESAAPTYALWSLSRTARNSAEISALFDSGVDKVVAQLPTATGGFWSDFAAFIGEFGYRGPSEWDLGTESWESKPSLALALIDRMRLLGDDESPSANQAAHAAATDKAMLEATEGMDAATEAAFRGAVGSARRFAGWRESGKSSCIKIMNEARMALIELGERLAAAGVIDHSRQIFIALDTELDGLALGATHLREALRQRETDWNALKDLEVPTFLDGSKSIPPISSLPRKGDNAVARATVGSVLNGAAASQGIVEGRARVVLGTDAIGDFQPGEILVAPQTDPSWTPLFMVASAVIVNTGSMGSHAMIVARELGIPCVAGLPGATQMFKSGDLLRVDGAKGTIEVIETV
ncbi:MAG: PEP-utilizing enzyme [Actinobacteria bacterium]|nr:PEP-utilizing enzyme [Actinomycetota bacterium]